MKKIHLLVLFGLVVLTSCNNKIEKARKLVENSLCLQSSSNLSNENLNKIVSVLNG